MRFANVLMSSPETHKDRLADMVTRSDRNKWAESMELLVRQKCPFPTSYDVAATQGTAFAEFTYTEFAGGIFITTQSIDINSRISKLSAEERGNTEGIEENWVKIIKDKYELHREPEEDFEYPEAVCFTPANNAFDLMSWEIMCRASHDNNDLRIKPHPLCDGEGVMEMVKRVGWNKIIPRTHSGMDYLLNCSEAWTTSCSELTIIGALIGKRVHNMGNFFHEADGAYYPLTRAIFASENQKETTLNLAACEYSGLIFPWQSEEEIDRRITKFYAKALELREIYAPLYVKYPRKR